MATNALYYGDNLDVLRHYIRNESVDLVYLDPPFNSNASYNVLFREHTTGEKAAAQIHAFEDTWRWDEAASLAYTQTVESGGGAASALVAMQRLIPQSDMLAYLAMMAPRLVELHRVLKDDGSIFLHCDPTASHYLKIMMDAIFGPSHFRNEIVWCYYGPGSPNVRQFLRKHDIVLWYSKGTTWTFNRDDVRIPHSKKTAENFKAGHKGSGFIGDENLGEDGVLHQSGKVPEDWWTIAIAPRSQKEYLGYPTQKPLALLDRILRAASNKGDVVLDPFCGCGTTIDAAQTLDRKWIGIDITHLAIGLIKKRLSDRFGAAIEQTYEVKGEPTDASGAKQLADEDKFQFQAWALGLVGARLEQGKAAKKGPDGGVDGRLYFHDDKGGDTKQIVISVKGGKSLKADEVRALEAVRTREKAQVGVLISLATPTPKMRADAASAGFYDSPFGSKHPCVQLITVEELLNGRRIDYPAGAANVTVTQAVPPAQEQVKGQMDIGD